MKALIRSLPAFFFNFGGFGLFGLGVLDSSILIMPLGKDMLMVALTANRPRFFLYYAFMATAGSVVGCLLTDVLSRKGGEAGLEQKIPRRRLEFVKKRVRKNAGWALVVASIMPPPFPFTPFVAAAAAFQYPRKKMLAVLGAARFARYLVIAGLAIMFGPRIVRIAETPEVQYAILALVVISIVVTIVSIANWARRSKRAA